MSERFARFRRRDDGPKEHFLEAVAAGASDAAALERVGSAYPDAKFTEQTLRVWLRDDPEFAEALRMARTNPPGRPEVISLAEVAVRMGNEGKLDDLRPSDGKQLAGGSDLAVRPRRWK